MKKRNISVVLASAMIAGVFANSGISSFAQEANDAVIATETTETPTGSAITETSKPVSQVTVVYKRSEKTSWKKAYIHYSVNGKWTKVPGVKMKKVSDGKWSITIDVKDAKKIKACFNNGSGTWDNNDTKNYSISLGNYEVDAKKKTVKKISVVDPTEVPATEVPATEVPATEVPATEVPATEAPATEVPATEAPATEVPATEAPATEVPATEAPATEVPATEAPVTEEPTIVPTAPSFKDCAVIVYDSYEAATWKNAYIHYKVGNGQWTKVPGVKMDKDEASGTYSYTIPLGNAKNVTVCFTDGKGKWDNNNKKNYVFEAGMHMVSHRENR